MANLENNSENENKKSVPQNIGDSVQKSVENVQETVKETVKEATELANDAMKHPMETAGEFVDQAAKDVVSVKWWAKLLQIIFWIVLTLVFSILVFINLPWTKNWAAQKVISNLNEQLKSQIKFESVDVNYFGDVTIHKVFINDYKNFPFLKAEKLYADSDWFSIISNSRDMQFQSMSLDKMDLKVITYKGDSISNFIRFVDLFDDGKARDQKKKPFQLKSRIFITNSKASIVNQNSEGEAGKWLTADNLSLNVPELRVKGADIFAQINNLRFTTERYGKKHFVETFSTNLILNKKFLFLDDLTFNTENSLLQGDLKFNLNRGKWEDFTNKVRWDMNLKPGSQISGYDISYFVTNWDNYKPINISGRLNGPLNKFYLSDFLVRNPQVNVRTDFMRVNNILNGDFLIESNKISTDFTYQELKAMMPTFISSKMKNFADDFGRLKYNGAAKVTPQQVFVPSANLITGIGQAKITNFTLSDYSTDLPKFSGFAEVNDLNTSVITKSKEVGLISGKFNVKGQSFDVNTMRLETKSQISKIIILNKEINNLHLDGLLDHRKYNGLISINDEQAKGNVKGLIDFSKPKIFADINADFSHLNINYFTEQKGNQVFSGKVDGQIAMSNINDMNLDVNFNDINFTNGIQKFNVNQGKVKAYFENGNRIVSANIPGIVEGQISGKYNIGDLAGMVENGIGKILVGPPPRKLYRGQRFNADFKVEQGLMSYFLPNLQLPKGASINGGYNGDSNNLVLNVESAGLQYKMNDQTEIKEVEKVISFMDDDDLQPIKLTEGTVANIDNVIVRINTENLSEQIFARIDRIQYKENVLKDVTLSGKNETGNLLHLATNFKHGTREEEMEEKLKEYAININQSTDNFGDYVFRFEPTEVKFNNVVWNIDTSPELDHSITYRKATSDFLIKNLRIFSDDSQLFVKNSVFKSGDDFEVDAEVKNFQISKIFEMQKSGNTNDITGLASGAVFIKKDKDNLIPLIDFNIDKIMMNNQDLGNFDIQAKSSSTPNVYDIVAKVVSAGIIGDNNLEVTGTVNNNTKSPTLDLDAKMKDFDLAFAQTFVNGVFSNLRGKATGDLKILGTVNDIDYTGDIALKNFGLKLNFTGVDYSFDDTVIPLSKGLAILNDIGVKDGRSNSKGSISGAIQFETLASMGVNLVMRADNLLLLNTTQKDFDLFWGRVYGQGDLFVDGPVSSLNISTPNMSALNNSVFTFNSNSTSNVEEFKMLRFLKEDKTGNISLEEKKKSGANMNLDFTLNVDKGTTVNVLVGDDIGDITVRGNAEKLRFEMKRSGSIYLDGDYIVDNGTFISKAILERKFQIAKNSSIRWDGDAMSPDLDINAYYMRTVSNATQYLNIGSLPAINVMLTAKITQKLTDPDIKLGVAAQDVSSQVREALAEKMNNEDEKVIQFGSVLVLSSFNVTNAGFSVDLGKTAESSVGNMLFKQLGSVLNTISDEFKVDLNYISGNDASNTGDRANANFSFELSPRVTVKTGVGIPVSKTENTSTNFLSGEGTIEYDWSKNNDGTRVFRAYSKPANIGMATANNPGANQSYGVGVVYSTSSNSIKTLFKSKGKNKKNKKQNTEIKRDSIKKDTLK